MSILRIAAGVFLGLCWFALLLACIAAVLAATLLRGIGKESAGVPTRQPTVVVAPASASSSTPTYPLSTCRRAVAAVVERDGIAAHRPAVCQGWPDATVSALFRQAAHGAAKEPSPTCITVPPGWRDCGEGYHYVGGCQPCARNV